MQSDSNKPIPPADDGDDTVPAHEYAGFLVSDLKLGEGLIIDDKSVVIIHKTSKTGATLAIRAPKAVKIRRMSDQEG